MADEGEVERTFKEKVIFYTTAFFILLGTFSMFGFLFLVPFVIDPAFTTIFMQFDTTPALCYTVDVAELRGASNCSWTSCKEGCTKELFTCLQIFVSYKIFNDSLENETQSDSIVTEELNIRDENNMMPRAERYEKPPFLMPQGEEAENNKIRILSDLYYPDEIPPTSGLAPKESDWYFYRARFFPNVKGCGYPPYLNCTIWQKKYMTIGSNYSCYYSQVDPRLVISDLDLHQNSLNLIYSIAIPIPSFIISVIYLTFAYFKIYNEDEDPALLDKNAEGTDGGGEDDEDDELNVDASVVKIDKSNSGTLIPNGSTVLPTSGGITPNSDGPSFGHQLKVKMADEMSRDSLDGGLISNSGSIQGYVIILFKHLFQ